MRKIITGLGIALTALTLTLATPTTTEAKTKYLTAKEIGKKIVSYQKTANDKKVKITRRFYFKSMKQGEKIMNQAYVEAAKLQYGKAYGKGLRATSDSFETWTDSGFLINTKKCTYEYVLNGKSKAYRKDYRDDECVKKLLIELKGFTKGKSQFDRAWITMCWFKARSTYCEGAHKYTSNYDLYKRNLITDCDGLAGKYAFYARQAGVRNVGIVSDGDHMWNWIKVDGKRYYIDYQSADCTASHNYSVKKCVELSMDPFYHDNWDMLWRANEWYKENVDADAKDFTNCKKFWDTLTKEQQKAFSKRFISGPRDKYEITCSSYSQTRFRPLDAFLEYWMNASNPKTWKHQ